MSPRRPRPSFERTREILSFSAGVWLVNLNSFFSRQADRLIMGRLLPMGALGGYSVAIDLARLPSAELILPMSRALVPGYAKVKHDVERMARLFKALLGAVAVLSAPIAFGFPLIAGDFIFVVLGEKWTFIVPMLQIAAVLAVIELVAGCNRPLLLAAGSMMMLNIVLTLETIIGLSAIYPAYLWRQEEGVLLTFTAVRCAVLLGLLGLSAVTLRVRFGELLQSFLRPFLAGGGDGCRRVVGAPAGSQSVAAAAVAAGCRRFALRRGIVRHLASLRPAQWHRTQCHRPCRRSDRETARGMSGQVRARRMLR